MLTGVVLPIPSKEETSMPQEFRRGDRVEWNFRGRTVIGSVRKRLTSRTEVAGQVVAGSKEDPRYLVRT